MPTKKKLTIIEKNALAYARLSLYVVRGALTFNIKKEPHIKEFVHLIGEPVICVAECRLNTQEHFPIQLKKDGTPKKNQREYCDLEDESYEGKKIDYIELDPAWKDNNFEWLYCLTYDGRIVKIGMTIKSLFERFVSSYSCGTARAMRLNTCSSTNFILSECNFVAKKNDIKVEIYGIRCDPIKKKITRFGITKECRFSGVRDQETMLTQRFKDEYNHIPILCVQEGK